MFVFRNQKLVLHIILTAFVGGSVAFFSATGFAQWAQQPPASPTMQNSNGQAAPASAEPAADHASQPAADAPTQLSQPPAMTSDAVAPTPTTPTGPRHRTHHHAATQTAAPAPKQAARPVWSGEHDMAVKEARNGDTTQAVGALEKLYKQHPGDVGITRDYLVVLSWQGGHDDEVIRLYKSLNSTDQPDYVLLAVAHSYRGLKDPDAARVIYERGLSRTPKSESFAAGMIYSLSDEGYAETAMKLADSNVQQYGPRSEVLVAAGDAADQYGENDKALSYYSMAYANAPQNREAIRGVVRSKDRAGQPAEALQIADAHPGVFPPDEYRHIQGDVVAYIIRTGQTDAKGESDRFTTTDRAIKMSDGLIAQWSNDPSAKPDVIRLRLDRIIALRNRVRMQEVVSEYNTLVQQGVTVPPYVLSSVGDAYLYLHEPEKARDIFLEVLKTDPKNFDVRRQLFYAYVECDDYDNAFATIDDLQHDRPYWANLAGEPNPALVKRNENIAQMAAGAGRQYSGKVRASENWIMPLVQADPASASSHDALGNLYAAHGWPRKALAEYQSAVSASGGKNLGSEVGIVEADLQLQRYPEAEAKVSDLTKRVPENLGVQRAQRDVDIYNMSEVRLTVGYAFRPMTTQSVNGGEAYGIDAMYYTPPIGYNWRLFAGEFYTHQDEPNREGAVGFSRSTVGVEYRNNGWTADLAPTYNHYNGTQRFGADGDVSYAIDDQWTVAGAGELFSRDTPLRALNQGITSNEFAAHAVWRQDENREIRFGGDVQPFSDGNTRTGLNGSYAQNVMTVPDFNLDGLVDLGESQNSKNENRPYFNPSQDFIALLGPRATQVLYQRYATVWSHSLRLEPGIYWQENYGTSAAFRARYEHRVRFDNVFDMGAGINYNRQAYDGVPENDVSLTLDLTGHF